MIIITVKSITNTIFMDSKVTKSISQMKFIENFECEKILKPEVPFFEVLQILSI